MGLIVIKPGWQTLIMDLGREDARPWGVPKSGALDPHQYQWANILVGETAERIGRTPVLEIRSGNVILEFDEDHLFVMTGSPGEYELDGKRINTYSPSLAKKGQRLHIRNLYRNGTIYLAVNGNWELPSYWGSYSSDILSPLPGLGGRALLQHDRISISSSFITFDYFKRLTPNHMKREPEQFDPVFRIIGGPELNLSEEKLKKILEDSDFTILRNSNRMGYRLQSSISKKIRLPEIISSIVTPGMIQWTPGNQPILLLPNCQTTGGYPRVAKVIEADLWKLAYTGPGDSIRFLWSTPDEARYLMEYQQGQFEIAWRNISSS